jgi:glucosamine-6-phosphate deaminase
VRVVIEPNPDAAARFAARCVAEWVTRKPECVLALAAGATMVPVYREVVALHQRERVSFARARAFDLDEYAGLAGDDPRSFVRFVCEHVVERVDFSAGHHFAPDACRRPRRRVRALRGRHRVGRRTRSRSCSASVGNGPRLQRAGRVARRPHPRRGADAPAHHRERRPRPAAPRRDHDGPGTLLAARACLVVAFGAEKERPAAEMIEGPVTSLVPASVLQHHPHTTVVLDDAAAALLVNAAHYREVETLRRELEKNARG